MSAIQMRPTFALETELSEEEVVQRIQNTFSGNPDGEPANNFQGQFVRGHAMISINQSARHFWSPWMHLEIRESDQHRLVIGRFSPHPSIWTGFMFSFLAIAVLIVFAAMFGVSQQLSGQTPWAYCFIPCGLSVVALLWFISKTGQKLARDEMEHMRSSIEKCLGDAPSVR
jgi:hypothetical protein